MNTYVAFGIFGIISSFVAALADVPLVKPGKPDPNESLAVNGINPWWNDHRGNLSILLIIAGM